MGHIIALAEELKVANPEVKCYWEYFKHKFPLSL